MRRRSTRIWQRMTALVLTMAMLCTLAPAALAEEPNGQPEYQISISPDNRDFGTVNEGYGVGEGEGEDLVQPWIVDVMNVGSGHENSLIVSLEGENQEENLYEFFDLSTTEINWSKNESEVERYELFTVAPKPGLAGGTYLATLKVSGTHSTATAKWMCIRDRHNPHRHSGRTGDSQGHRCGWSGGRHSL